MSNNDGWGAAPSLSVNDAWDLGQRSIFNPSAVVETSLEIRYTKHQTVVGIRVGDLFVHEDVLEWGKMIVSHVPTRLQFMRAVPEPFAWGGNLNYTKDQLVSWCQRVQQQKRVQWEILSTLLPYGEDMELTDKEETARDIIRDHCLGIAVV